MRLFMLAAALGACAMLSGCDQNQPQQVAQVASPAPTCACRPTPPLETASVAQPAPAIVHHHHRHWAHRQWAGNYSRTDFTESVLAPYDYVSGSSVSYVESNESYGEYAPHPHGWHRHETYAAAMTGHRLDPWHGYDVDCPQR